MRICLAIGRGTATCVGALVLGYVGFEVARCCWIARCNPRGVTL